MSLATTIDTSHYAMIPIDVVLKTNLTATALKLLVIFLGYCGKECNEAWGDTGKLAEQLGCGERNVQMAYNELIDAGLIRETGKTKWYWRVFEVLCHPLHKLKQELTESTPRPKQEFAPTEAPVRAYQNKEQNNFKNNNNAEKIQNEVYKEKTEEVVVYLDNKTIETLRDKGIAIEQAQKLVAAHGDDACLKQVQHLESLLKENKPIKNPIAWLVSAIKQKFAPPEVKAEAPKMSEMETKHRELLHSARLEIRFGNWPGAAMYARRALELGEHPVFHKIIADAKLHAAKQQ